MSIQLQEIQSIYISQNRLVEGKDYVRAEWLKGTGCYIDTLINPAWNDQLSATTEVSGRPTVENPKILTAYGTNTRVGMILGGAWYKNNIQQFLVINRVNGTDGWIEFAKFPANAELYCSFKVVNNSIPTISFKANGASRNISNIMGSNIITELPDTTYKIGDSLSGLNVLKLKNVKINSHNFTPCQLLRPIPATLDANGIARSAGECGMIDSISGKFYGNVASSGSFTVENLDESGNIEDTRLHQIYTNKLVENVDYRCYDWIERKSSATGYMFGITISNTADTVVRIWNYKVQGSNGRDMIYLNNTNHSNYFIFPDANAAGQTLMRHSDQSATTVLATGQDIELTLRSGKINSITTLAYKSIGICPSTVTGNLTKVGRIYSDTYDYVPCKLLRAIPANRTMNGKSYPAGTMGMIEKVSKKFQPIANAAQLWVLWDEWLKDCSIQFDMEQTLGITNYAPPTIIYKGRIDATKLTSELTDFGYVKISNTQIVCNQQTWSFSNWGSNKWATIEVSYGGNGGCNVNVNGTNIGSQTTQVTGIFNPHIFLYDIVQLNKIDYTFYPVQSDPTRSVNLIFSRGVDESLGKQYMTDNDGATYRIYAD